MPLGDNVGEGDFLLEEHLQWVGGREGEREPEVGSDNEEGEEEEEEESSMQLSAERGQRDCEKDCSERGSSVNYEITMLASQLEIRKGEGLPT